MFPLLRDKMTDKVHRLTRENSQLFTPSDPINASTLEDLRDDILELAQELRERAARSPTARLTALSPTLGRIFPDLPTLEEELSSATGSPTPSESEDVRVDVIEVVNDPSTSDTQGHEESTAATPHDAPEHPPDAQSEHKPQEQVSPQDQEMPQAEELPQVEESLESPEVEESPKVEESPEAQEAPEIDESSDVEESLEVQDSPTVHEEPHVQVPVPVQIQVKIEVQVQVMPQPPQEPDASIVQEDAKAAVCHCSQRLDDNIG